MTSTPPAMFFEVLKPATNGLKARIARLALPARTAIDTPHHVGITSRGAVPHLSQDNYLTKTGLQGVYVALEDFIEKASNNATPPVVSLANLPSPSPLRDFIALDGRQLLVLGARRVEPVISPWATTHKSIPIYTSVGFAHLDAADYSELANKLRPDIVVGLGDVVCAEKPGLRRIEKMSSRTEHLMKDIVSHTDEAGHDGASTRGKLFAPILPIDHEQQSFYLDRLVDDWLDKIAGLAIYEASTAVDLPQELDILPKLSLSPPETPHHLLRQISLGIDLYALSFIGSATDSGVALCFCFPPDVSDNEKRKPLGIDMWSNEHAINTSPLVEECKCYACQRHHRAYVQHLLSAKEMLAWVLLQIHNHHVVDAFFAGVRASIADDRFEEDSASFGRAYELSLPEITGKGPRVRGYQYKSSGPGEGKRNEPAFKVYEKTQKD